MTREEAMINLDMISVAFIKPVTKEQRKLISDTFDASKQALIKGSKVWCCEHCKWWKDSDGVYRRGIEAESQCPINRREVFEGVGYCYMFELYESEEV